MYRIGYVDDEPKYYGIFSKKLQRRFKDVELVFLDECNTKEQFVEKIYEKQVEVVLVDYKMVQRFGFNGSALISYINDEIRDLECFILTAVECDSINDGQVAYRNIRSKSIFDTEADDEKRVKELVDFVDLLKESADVFKTRRELKKVQYLKLFEKRKAEGLSMPEEEEYIRLYKVLSSYGMIEKLPESVLTSNFETDLKKLLQVGEAILSKHKS